MKGIYFVILMVLGLTYIADAQIRVPQLSPLEKIETKIGMVEVELIYSRPSMRNRVIFGDLVPYNKVWRTGANRNTKITFSEEVLVGDIVLPAGSYSIFSKPQKDFWEIYFHTELNEFGAPDTLDSENILVTLKINPNAVKEQVETFTLRFKSHTSNSAVLRLSWENTQLDIPISTDTDQLLQSKLYQSIVDLAKNYEGAAWIYFDKEKDYAKALSAINRCIEIMEAEIPFEKWVADESNLGNPNRPRRYLTKAQVLAALGQKSEAIVQAKKSLEIAHKIKSQYYIDKNSRYIEEWEQ